MRKLLSLGIIMTFIGQAALAQNVGVDVATPQQKLDVAGGLKIGTTANGVAGSLRWTGTVFQFHDGTQWVSLNANTDDQQFDVIQLNGTALELSIEDDGQAPYSIDLSSFLDNTDNQQFDQVSINGSNQLLLSISGDGQPTHILDLSGYLDDTDEQSFDVIQLSGNNLEFSIENDGVGTHVIDLSGFLDNTDDQTIDVFNLTGNELRLSIEDDGQPFQTVDLSGYLDNTDDQGFDVVQLSGNNLEFSIENDGVGTHTIDLSGYLDNTDDQTIDVFNLTGNELRLSIEDDGQPFQTVDLSGYLDNTDDQGITDFSLSGTTLTLQVESDAGGPQSVDLTSLQRGLEDDDGDTKVEVEATPDEDQIRFSTGGGEAMRINSTQQVGIGVASGIENQLVVQGSNSDATAVLGLRGGNEVATFNGGAQIAFGFDGDDTYQHFIHTRHNSAGGATNNAIDFYVSDGTQNNTVTSGSTHVMSMNSGNVGIGTTSPADQLHVVGSARISSLASANELVISDVNGKLVNTNSLVGTGLGDNLGNHTATTNLNMTNREVDNITQLDMTPGNGNGLRFWSSNSYKISMGNATEYRYGAVQDYSIKNAMNAQDNRGWTWGADGSVPVAALSTRGHMTLRGALFLDCVDCGSTSTAYPNGGSGWGDAVIQGRVISANSNLHLSPPGGSNVIIDDTYRAAGGSNAGSAGLQVERLATGTNRAVLADANGVLYAGTLNGTGLGDNLGNHTATTTLNMAGNDIDFIRGDQGQIRSVGTISFDWTSGSYDDSRFHGIESKNEAGNFSDNIRINSYNDVTVTLDANNNNGTSYFKVQEHSIGNGDDLLSIRSSDGEAIFGRGNGTNRMLLNGNGIYLYDGWFRNHGVTGLYNESYGNHWYAENASYWISRSNNGIAIRNVGNTTRGYLYHNNGDEFGLLDRDGNWAVRTVRDQYVELRDNNEVMFRAGQGGVTGDYGSVQTYGAGKNGWDGYNIEGRYVLMSNGSETLGLYNDIDNRWIQLFDRNSYHRIYDSNGDDYVEFNNNCDLNFRDNNIYDVERLSVNTIYDADGPNLVHFDPTHVRFDVGSSRDIWFDQWDGNHPQIRPGTAGYGFNGRFNNYWYETYTLRIWRNQEYFFSDRRVKKNIRNLEGNESLDKIMSIRPVIYDINEETHPTLGENPPEHVLKDNIGFIAQELMEVVPEAVILDDRTGFYAIKNVEQLLPIVIEAMQEQQRQIEALSKGVSPRASSQIEEENKELREMLKQLHERVQALEAEK